MQCPICKKFRSNKDELISHVEKSHGTQIPDNMDSAQYLYYLTHGGNMGKCIVCHVQTEWNYDTRKPNRLCEKKECREHLREIARKNEVAYYGDNTPHKDPEFQRRALQNKKSAKVYKFKDGGEIVCLSKDEYNLLSYLERFLDMNSKDVIECPHVFTYDDNGIERKYLPDLLLLNYDVIIEQKDAGNTNPEFLKETRYKVKLKADAVEKDGRFHYVIVYGNNYKPLINMLFNIKNDKLKNRESRPMVIHNESISNDFYLGICKVNDVLDKVFFTDDRTCSRVYINEGANIVTSSICSKYFKNKNVELYTLVASEQKKYALMKEMIPRGEGIMLETWTPEEFIQTMLESHDIDIHIDGLYENVLGLSDFVKVGELTYVNPNELLNETTRLFKSIKQI
jgi:hypothetical protein